MAAKRHHQDMCPVIVSMISLPPKECISRLMFWDIERGMLLTEKGNHNGKIKTTS